VHFVVDKGSCVRIIALIRYVNRLYGTAEIHLAPQSCKKLKDAILKTALQKGAIFILEKSNLKITSIDHPVNIHFVNLILSQALMREQ
jgi:hypothetical protein